MMITLLEEYETQCKLPLGLIWGSRDDTRADMEKVMY